MTGPELTPVQIETVARALYDAMKAQEGAWYYVGDYNNGTTVLDGDYDLREIVAVVAAEIGKIIETTPP